MDFRDPRGEYDDGDEAVVSFEPPADGFKPADFKRWNQQILRDQFSPVALNHPLVSHQHRYEKVYFQHSHARAKGVVESVAPRFDPKHHGDDGEVEKRRSGAPPRAG